MAHSFLRGAHLFFPFSRGATVQDSQCKPRYYLSKEQFMKYGRRYEMVEYAEVIHAHWISIDEWMTDECSNCGARIDIEDFDECSYHPRNGRVELDYCPNCGAKMDLDEVCK